MREKFEAFDGKAFDNRQDCVQYELRLAWIRDGFSRYKGDMFYAARFIVEEFSVTPDFAFFITSVINKHFISASPDTQGSERGFTSWLAEYFDDVASFGIGLNIASQSLKNMTPSEREMHLKQATDDAAGYVDTTIDWEESLHKFINDLDQNPGDPFLVAGVRHLFNEVEGFKEAFAERLRNVEL